MAEIKGSVLNIYTGGTIGMLPSDPENPLSPLVPADWDQLKHFVPSLNDLPLHVELHEMKLIDSSDMHPDYWIEIARVIRDNYDKYDGFVIMHGTDTMTYTASALSFLLENLDKPVIVTGSQISISQPRNDAVQNLVTSLMFASPKTFNLPLIPEVTIFFNNVLLRGNRARKVSSSDYAGFETPNYKTLGTVGEHIKVDTTVIRPPSDEGFFIHENLEHGVLVFDIFPGLKPAELKYIFNAPDIKGIIFRTFGAGNAPTKPEFLAEIENAVKAGKAVVNITQCTQGMVEMGLYDASAGLLKLGVISGVDMTPDAAVTKMMWLLGMGYDIETVKDLMQKDQRGEQSVNVFNFIYDEAMTKDDVYPAPAKQVPSGFEKEKISAANIRINDAKLVGKISEGEIELALFMNLPNADASTDTSTPQCLGTVKSPYRGKPENLIIPCTDKVSQLLNPKRPVQLTVVSKNGQVVEWEGLFMAIYTDAN